MPAGISNPMIGYSVFCGIKMAGYTLAAHHLNKTFPENQKSILMVGVTRTVIGMLVGLFLKLMIDVIEKFYASTVDGLILVGYFFFLFPLRMLEWGLLLKIFFKDQKTNNPDFPLLTKLGLWSYFLDIPAAIGFIFTAGFWIC